MNFLRRIFCSHDFRFVRNLYGDQIIEWGYKRSIWECIHCGKWQGRDELRETNTAGPDHLAPQPAPGLEFDHRGVLVPSNREAPPPIAWASDALRDVAAERRRQIEVEFWTPEHDDIHRCGELAMAASCYANPAPFMETFPSGAVSPEGWPWAATWWKPKDRRSNLVRAGALILAEIERLDRT